MHPITFSLATLDQIMQLRYDELRAGLPRETACFEGDDAADTFHFGAFTPAGTNVGCASFMLNSFQDQPAYQLRGMATHHVYVGTGIGGKLLRCGELHIQQHTPIRQLWCNARVHAIAFYRKQGWTVMSEPFDVPTAGPHCRMAKQI